MVGRGVLRDAAGGRPLRTGQPRRTADMKTYADIAALTVPGRRRLLARLRAVEPAVVDVAAEHVHFVDLAGRSNAAGVAGVAGSLPAVDGRGAADDSSESAGDGAGGLGDGAGGLTAEDEARLRGLLTYGEPFAGDRGGAAGTLVVLPRLGTISPWSSKASDIAAAAGLDAVRRIERGTVYYLY